MLTRLKHSTRSTWLWRISVVAAKDNLRVQRFWQDSEGLLLGPIADNLNWQHNFDSTARQTLYFRNDMISQRGSKSERGSGGAFLHLHESTQCSDVIGIDSGFSELGKLLSAKEEIRAAIKENIIPIIHLRQHENAEQSKQAWCQCYQCLNFRARC